MQAVSRRPREGEVRLTSFFTYRGRPPDRITLGDVPLPSGLKPPAGGLTTLIGFRDALEELQFQRQLAEARGEQLVSVTIRLGVDELYNNFTDLDNVSKKHVINLNRLSPDLFEIVKNKLGDTAADSVTNFVVERPELLSRVHDDRHFNHVDLLVYRIPDPYKKARRIGTLFSSQHVIDVAVSDLPDIMVALPVLESSIAGAGKRRH